MSDALVAIILIKLTEKNPENLPCLVVPYTVELLIQAHQVAHAPLLAITAYIVHHIAQEAKRPPCSYRRLLK
jgi:hypothetical protein